MINGKPGKFQRCLGLINELVGSQDTKSTYKNQWYFFLKKYLSLERGEGREKEKERNINVWLPLACPKLGTWSAVQARALTGKRNSHTLVHGPVLSPLSHTSQDDSLAVSYKIRHVVTTWSSNCTFWYLLKLFEYLCPHKKTVHELFLVALLIISKTWKQPRHCSTDEERTDVYGRTSTVTAALLAAPNCGNSPTVPQ